MKAVIVGCSRLGARLAVELTSRGYLVSVIDVDALAFRRLPDSFTGKTIIGTGIDEDVLMSAGIVHADVFISATNGDNRNIMAAQLARHAFGVKHVLCRIYDPVRADAYARLGIDTICPTVEIATKLLDRISAGPGRES